MLDLSKIFFLTLIVSMIGSLQIGPISILVMFTTLKHDLKSALKVAFIGVLPEYLYSLVAYFGYSYLSQKPETLRILEMGVIPLFFLFGIINILKKEKENAEVVTPSVKQTAVRAFQYGIFNPMLISFWMLSLLLIGNYVRIQSPAQIVAFWLATGTGGFLTKLTFSLLTVTFRDKVFLVFKRFSINKIVGVLFILLAVVQFIKFLAK
jgi:threonine/homoserine/homoserine lactone efflux protein